MLDVKTTEREVVLTRRGAAGAVVQNGLLMLKFMVQGEADIQAGRTTPQDQVFAEIKAGLTTPTDG